MDTTTPISSSIQPISPANTGSRQRSPGQQTTVGQLLKAIVVEAKGENQFVLDFTGNRQPVRSESKLRIGQALQLQVIKTSPQIELKIVTDTLRAVIGRSLTLLDSTINITSLYKGLQKSQNLTKITLSSQTVLETFFTLQQSETGNKDGGVQLKKLIDLLGLNLEKLLSLDDKAQAVNTLKSALLEISNSFQHAKSLAESTTRILSTIELFQFTQLNNSGNSVFILPLPLPFLDQGYLVVEKQDQQESDADESKKSSRFSLYLTMSELGNLHLGFINTNNGLLIRFQTESEQISTFVQTFSDDLIDAISGEEVAQLSFSGDAPDPRHDLIQYLIPEGQSMLDTTI